MSVFPLIRLNYYLKKYMDNFATTRAIYIFLDLFLSNVGVVTYVYTWNNAGHTKYAFFALMARGEREGGVVAIF